MESKTFEKIATKKISFNYLICVPNGFVKGRDKLPLMLFLHGAGERGDDPEKLKTQYLPIKYINENPKDFILVCPQCKEGEIWHNRVEEIMEFTESIANEYGCDKDRISITGISMGGYGTWHTIQAYPHYFSAAAPICGGGTPWFAGVLKELPIRAFHGLCDTTVKPQNTIDMIEAIKAAGGIRCEMTLYENTAHDSWTYTYEKTDVLEWLVSQKKQ